MNESRVALAEYLRTDTRRKPRRGEGGSWCGVRRDRINPTVRTVAGIKESKSQVVTVRKDR